MFARRAAGARTRFTVGATHELILGYIAPADKLTGLAQVIRAEHDRRLEEALLRRGRARLAANGCRAADTA